jgi:hypothetical protein
MIDKVTHTEEGRAGLVWRTAQASTYNGQCVEVASTSGKIVIRDSKDPDGPILAYAPEVFRGFLDDARSGRI